MTSQPNKTVLHDRPKDPRAVLTDLYWSGVKAVAPDAALRFALDKLPALERGKRLWIIALGKAAAPMARAAADVLHRWGREPAGGIVVAPQAAVAPHPSLECVIGDHPLPGANSFHAASQLGTVVGKVRGDDEVWVLLSGGASSLVAAPDGAVHTDDLLELYRLLLGAGIDIVEMNAIRKRFTRWSGGRLARALHPATVRQFTVSDVIGDDLASIASGPCVPDPSTAADVHQRLSELGLWERLPTGLRHHLSRIEHDPALETPKPGDAVFRHVEKKLIASNRLALEAIAARAKELGYQAQIITSSLSGEASAAGRKIASTLVNYCGVGASALTKRPGPTCLVWGGEATVTIPGRAASREQRAETAGGGGRCQELALAAAKELVSTAGKSDITLLAAGTDGRDGPTDAAGGIVDGQTWKSIARAGRDPEHDLAEHNSNPSLRAAGALFITGHTHTNVMDVMIGICTPVIPS